MQKTNKLNKLMLLLIAFGLWAGISHAQTGYVGINVEEPHTTLEVKRLTDLSDHYPGIIAPHVTGDELHGKPYDAARDGAFVYVTAAANDLSGQTEHVKCAGYYYYAHAQDAWMPFEPCDRGSEGCGGCELSTNGTAKVSSYGAPDCTAGSISGAMKEGVVVSGVTMTIYANVTELGSYNLKTTITNGVVFAGSGEFTSLGCQEITLTASGTPISGGTHHWSLATAPTETIPATVASDIDDSTGGTGTIGSSPCGGHTNGFSGTMKKGESATGTKMELWVDVTKLGTWNMTTAAVNGVTYSGNGTFTTLGCQKIELNGSGTFTNDGDFTWSTTTTPAYSATGNVASPFTPPAGDPDGAGSLSGKTCFDVALGNDNTNSCGPLSARTANKADFTQAATYQQTYTFTPQGAVSNVRFNFVNTNGNVIVSLTADSDYSGNNISTTCTATAMYSQSLNTEAQGLTNANPLKADIFVTYNDQADGSGSDKFLKLTAKVKDCACCGAKVSATEWKEFMCHNLGADQGLDPHTPNVGLIGSYIQWGKNHDMNSTTNDGPGGFAAAPTAANPNAGAISGWSQTNAPNNAWNSGTEAAPVKTANDPCPAGYRVPTKTEWEGVKNPNYNAITRTGTSWANNATNYTTAIHFGPKGTTAKLLTLPAAGYRSYSNGALNNRGYRGYYWSSTASSSTSADNLSFNSGSQDMYVNRRRYGFSLRCIAE